MAINQISTANTFEQWLIATQQLIAFANSITNSAPGTTFTSNTEEYVITGNLTLGNTLTAVTVNTDVIIFDDGTRLSSNVSIVNSYNHANGAFDKANAAYNYANTISLSGEIAGDNVIVLYTVTGNNIVANTSITTPTITVTNNVVTDNVTANLITAVDVNTTSDISLKTNIHQITNSLDTLEKITGIAFNWKSDGLKSYGISAQEIEKVLPEIVKTRGDGYKGVNYLNLIAFLIEAIKELKKEMADIKKTIK